MIVAYIELILMLLKATVFAFGYSVIIVIVVRLVLKKKSWLSAMHKFFIWLWVVIALLTYRFSYWENCGLGESLRIPIGHGQAIENVDLETSYFFPNLDETDLNEDELKIKRFAIRNKNLCAEVLAETSDGQISRYMVYNLETETLLPFTDVKKFEEYAKRYNLPSPIEFEEFYTHYLERKHSRPILKKWFFL